MQIDMRGGGHANSNPSAADYGSTKSHEFAGIKKLIDAFWMKIWKNLVNAFNKNTRK